jgi:peptide deformylase
MKRKLVLIPSKLLRQKSNKIGFIDDSIRKLAQDMIDTTIDWDHQSEFGAALAAIQIGKPLKLTVVRKDFDNPKGEDFITLVNPEIVKKSSDTGIDMEGCLSVPGVYGRVKRSNKIKIKAKDLDGNEIRFSAEGFAARVIQHEIDHMNGKIFLDHVKDAKDLFEIDENGKLNPIEKDEK